MKHTFLFSIIAVSLIALYACKSTPGNDLDQSTNLISQGIEPDRVRIISSNILLDGKIVGAALVDEKISSSSLPKTLPDGISGYKTTLLDENTIWLSGGFLHSQESPDKTSNSTFFWDTRKAIIQPGPSLSCSRAMHNILPLKAGEFLVTGGITDPGNGKYCQVIELFNSQTKKVKVAGKLAIGRIFHSTLQLNSDAVLVVGGQVEPGSSEIETAAIELVNLRKKTSEKIGALCHPRQDASLIRLDHNQVLVVGGWNSKSEKNSSNTLPPEIISLADTLVD